MDIIKGKIKKPIKLVIYGTEGIGKSTFASRFPDPLFIDTEGSTVELDVARLETPSSWQFMLAQIDFVKQQRPCKTLIIDTADWAEKLCIRSICSSRSWSGIEDAGYGKGYTYLEEEFGRMLNQLTDVINAGINVVITAHAQIKKFEQPDEMGAYDRYELKLEKKTAALLKEWADIILFANYKTYSVAVDKDGKKRKAQGGQRVMYTSHHPCWDAKNRHGLPGELPFDYAGIAHLFTDRQIVQDTSSVKIPAIPTHPDKPLDQEIAQGPSTKTEIYTDTGIDTTPEIDYQSTVYQGIPQMLLDLMKANHISEDQVRKAVALKKYFPENMPIKDYPQDFVDAVLIAAWPKVMEMINEIVLPF